LINRIDQSINNDDENVSNNEDVTSNNECNAMATTTPTMMDSKATINRR